MNYTRRDCIGPTDNLGPHKMPTGKSGPHVQEYWLNGHKEYPNQWFFSSYRHWWDAQHTAEAGYTYHGYLEDGTFIKHLDESYVSIATIKKIKKYLKRRWDSIVIGLCAVETAKQVKRDKEK